MITINGKQWNNLRLKDVEKFLKTIDDDETFFIEFKSEDIRNTKLTKEISAFANSFGGYIFLGVDNNKNIIGCSNKWSELKINTIICNGISPTPQFDIKKFKIDDCKNLFIIKVEEGINPPYITNGGQIYQRVSSSSDQIKDSYTLNNLYQKNINNVKKIEDKLYISPITGIMPNNLCGYIDFGFSLISKNIEKIIEKIDKADITKISKILKNKGQKYSISKVGYSLSISVGDTSLSNGQEKMLVNGGLTNFMEILSDGSFRCRIILFSEHNSSIVSIASIITLYSLFSEIYKSIFGESFIKNFIEAKKYEKLNVLKLFQPKIITNIDDEYKIIFDNYHKEHLKKYDNNIIVNSNRIPLSGFLTLDKSAFELNKVKFNSENLYSQLFHTNYFLLGYFDEFPTIPNDENI